jgi:hypothetical protein
MLTIYKHHNPLTFCLLYKMCAKKIMQVSMDVLSKADYLELFSPPAKIAVSPYNAGLHL